MLLRDAEDSNFIGGHAVADDHLSISFFWAMTGKPLLACDLRENSSLADAYSKLQPLLPENGRIQLTKGELVYSKARDCIVRLLGVLMIAHALIFFS